MPLRLEFRLGSHESLKRFIICHEWFPTRFIDSSLAIFVFNYFNFQSLLTFRSRSRAGLLPRKNKLSNLKPHNYQLLKKTLIVQYAIKCVAPVGWTVSFTASRLPTVIYSNWSESLIVVSIPRTCRDTPDAASASKSQIKPKFLDGRPYRTVTVSQRLKILWNSNSNQSRTSPHPEPVRIRRKKTNKQLKYDHYFVSSIISFWNDVKDMRVHCWPVQSSTNYVRFIFQYFSMTFPQKTSMTNWMESI